MLEQKKTEIGMIIEEKQREEILEKERVEAEAKAKKEAEEREFNSPERWERIRLQQLDVFNKIVDNKDKKIETFEEFFELLKTNQVKNLVEFCKVKGIHLKNEN
jgi:hypothetical protein